MRRCSFALAMLIGVSLLVPVQATDPPLTVVDSVDLERYAGSWYEVARLPNRFQDQCTGDVVVHYTLRKDGRVDVLNTCSTAAGKDEARGVARRAEQRPDTAKLEVRFAPAFLSFLPFVWGDYWIIGLARDYKWAVVGDPSRKYLWILSRTPAIDPAAFQQASEIAKSKGFAIDKLIRTVNR